MSAENEERGSAQEGEKQARDEKSWEQLGYKSPEEAG